MSETGSGTGATAASGDADEPLSGGVERRPEPEPAPESPPDPASVATDAAVAAEAVAGPTRRQVAAESAAHRSRRRLHLRTSLTIGLFAVGLAVGVAGHWMGNAPAPLERSYPSLPFVGEPPAAAFLVEQLRENDSVALGEGLDEETLTAIRAQLNPLTLVDRVDFTSATTLADQTLAAYIVEGRDAQGARGVVGLILIVRDGTVVAQ